jgi:hypothetical protein
VPRAFVALTVHVYALPALRPVTVSGLAAPLLALATPPFDDVHVAAYDETAAPLFAPAVNVTRSAPAATFTAVTPVGAAGEPTITPGAPAGGPVPREFVAFTVHVYVFAVVTPVTTSGLAAPAFALIAPPFDETHVAA